MNVYRALLNVYRALLNVHKALSTGVERMFSSNSVYKQIPNTFKRALFAFQRDLSTLQTPFFYFYFCKRGFEYFELAREKMSIANRALLNVCRALLSMYTALLSVYRALLNVCRALLNVCRALLHTRFWCKGIRIH